MNKQQLVREIVLARGGIAKTADFVAAGLKNYDVSHLCDIGYLERLKHGYYCLAEQQFIQEERILATLLSGTVVCVESALFHYGYSDFTPRQWSIAVPRTFSRSRLTIDTPNTKIYYIQPDLFEMGKVTGDFNGVRLAVYDRERTICDCFKYRSKLDRELFNKAVHAYAADKEKNLRNLGTYAKAMRVYNKMMNLMEVLLNA